jgi:soluble epoxide hydrolase/lipid-phosphate phosphatase
VLHGPPASWLNTVCAHDGLKNYLLQGKNQQLEPYATEQMKNDFVQRFSRHGFQAPMCWYKAMVNGVQDYEAEKVKAVVVHVPALYVGFDGDKICRPEGIAMSVKNGLLPKLSTVTLEGGHWGLLANADKFGKTVVDWLDKQDFSSSFHM